MDTYTFYDEGWNARCRNEKYNPNAALAWRDGWKDCNESWDENNPHKMI